MLNKLSLYLQLNYLWQCWLYLSPFHDFNDVELYNKYKTVSGLPWWKLITNIIHINGCRICVLYLQQPPPTYTHNTHTQSELCTGSGVMERNVKNLFTQPHSDPSKGQHKSMKPESQEPNYLSNPSHTHTCPDGDWWWWCQDRVSTLNCEREQTAWEQTFVIYKKIYGHF